MARTTVVIELLMRTLVLVSLAGLDDLVDVVEAEAELFCDLVEAIFKRKSGRN